jgi:predicted Zn-dependent protease
MTPIGLVAVGNPRRSLLDALGPALAREFGTTCSWNHVIIDPRSAYHSERGQYHSTAILEQVVRCAAPHPPSGHPSTRSARSGQALLPASGEEEYTPRVVPRPAERGEGGPERAQRVEGPGEGLILLGVTEVDLFIPILTFVFGEAQLSGSSAIVSYHRLQQEFYGVPADEPLLVERTIKESVHEVGHIFGLTHCDDYACVMSPSHSVEAVDLKRAAMCDQCRISAAL